MIRRMLMGAVLLVALAGAPANAQYEDLVVSPDVGCSGSLISISGQGFAPNEEVTVYLLAGDQTDANNGPRAVPVPPGGTGVGVALADASGNVTASFAVPATTTVGTQTVVADSESQVRSGLLTVTECDTPPTTPGTTPDDGGIGGIDDGQGFGDGNGNGGTGNGNLARTGSNLNGLGLIGAGLLAVGGLVLVATRRRHGNGPARTATVA